MHRSNGSRVNGLRGNGLRANGSRANGSHALAAAIGVGLGPQLCGEKIVMNGRQLSVVKQLAEGGFSFVYLVKDETDKRDKSSSSNQHNNGNGMEDGATHMVLKISSIQNRERKAIADKEANLLRRLHHPSIVQMYDCCFRTFAPTTGLPLLGVVALGSPGGSDKHHHSTGKHYHHHLILMEYCADGHALDVMHRMDADGKKRFSMLSLVIAFGQISNAVSYLHAQKPCIVHRDIKPSNFLVDNGAYKLCDFGSAVFGHVPLHTARDRTDAEDVIQKTTTQMFRAPEMVDLYMCDTLTEATDVWALGCCLYSMAFFQDCFEENSNLAILSNNYKIPDDNPYGDKLVDLIDRMLTVDHRERANMTEVIMCLSAIYAEKPMPARRKQQRNASSSSGSATSSALTTKGGGSSHKKGTEKERTGKYRTDGQGIYHQRRNKSPKKNTEPKKLNPNSAAARRRAHRSADVNANTNALSLTTSTQQPQVLSPRQVLSTTSQRPSGPLNHENKHPKNTGLLSRDYYLSRSRSINTSKKWFGSSKRNKVPEASMLLASKSVDDADNFQFGSFESHTAGDPHQPTFGKIQHTQSDVNVVTDRPMHSSNNNNNKHVASSFDAFNDPFLSSWDPDPSNANNTDTNATNHKEELKVDVDNRSLDKSITFPGFDGLSIEMTSPTQATESDAAEGFEMFETKFPDFTNPR